MVKAGTLIAAFAAAVALAAISFFPQVVAADASEGAFTLACSGTLERPSIPADRPSTKFYTIEGDSFYDWDTEALGTFVKKTAGEYVLYDHHIKYNGDLGEHLTINRLTGEIRLNLWNYRHQNVLTFKGTCQKGALRPIPKPRF
jgi:hypothetical protein